MSLRNVFLLVILVLMALFAALNWSAFTTPTTLSLVFTTVRAPLGLLMLVAIALLTVLFLLYVAYLQSTVLLEARRSARELTTQRQLADEAEASRFTQLREVVDARITKLEADNAQSQASVKEAIEHAAADVRATVEQTGTVLTSYIGEVEDRLERASRAGSTVR